MMKVYDFNVENIDGTQTSLDIYKGKVLLIVNIATHCGYTPQLESLEELYQKYNDKGFEILAFPTYQFLGQSKGNSQKILNFCKLNYGVTFKVFAKTNVNGKKTIPLYQYLKQTLDIKSIRWNFVKFLINRQGDIVGHYDSKIVPEELEQDLLNIL